ncbi:hypothetical protein ACFLXA_02855 [Chloroflexota bacterium]
MWLCAFPKVISGAKYKELLEKANRTEEAERRLEIALETIAELKNDLDKYRLSKNGK